MEMRKMPGMSGELDEQPANSRESSIMATAMSSMSTW
jgi:hypothetical protein